MGGLDARVARHLRAEKKLHWHIDYLLERASVTEGQTESEKVVGVRRFELRTSASQTQRSSRLSYTPYDRLFEAKRHTPYTSTAR